MPQQRRRQGSGTGRGQAPARKSGGGGTFFLLLFAVIAAGGAAFVLAPDKVMELLGLKEAPVEQSTEEIVEDDTPKEKPKIAQQPKEMPKEQPKEQPKLKEPPKEMPKEEPKAQYTQEAEALSALKTLRETYAQFEWTKARTQAKKILKMDASKDTKAKAEHIIQASEQLQKFMKSMTSDQYGMTRGIYTSGSVVQVTYSNGKSENVVPIKSMNDKSVVKSNDPVGYVQGRLDSGKAYVMNEDDIPAEIKPDRISSVDPADMGSIKSKLEVAAREKLSKITSNEILRTDAIAIYEVARYTYEIGMDKPVTKLLERALLLDPDLANSVRNDRANEYYEKMVRSMQKGRKKTAAGHLKYLRKHFEDTYICKEAKAYYDGENAKIAQLQKAERERKQRQKDEAREKARKEAERKNDTAKLKEIEKIEKEEEEAQAEIDQPAAGGDEGKADALWAEGQDYLAQALADGADRAGKKDALLGKAFKKLMQAKNIYIKLVEGGNESVTGKMVQCGQDAYTAKKSMRP